MSDALFDIPPSLSPRLQWMEKHHIKIHYSPECAESPWLALMPFEEHRAMNIGDIMAEACRLYDEQGRLGYGSSEDDALAEMARKSGIQLWNEEGAR